MSDTVDSIQEQLNQLHNQHRTSEMAEAAQLMIAQLDLALHGYTTARLDTPRVWWLKLLAEVQSVASLEQSVASLEQRGYARGFAQGIAYAKARCGCEACNRLQSPSAPRVLGQVPPRPERGYAIDPFPSVRGSLLDPDPQETP